MVSKETKSHIRFLLKSVYWMAIIAIFGFIAFWGWEMFLTYYDNT